MNTTMRRVSKSGLGDADGIFLVAETAESDTAGFAEAVPPHDDDETWSLARIYVLPAYWGEGIGSRMLQWIEAEIRSQDGERLRLVVMANNEVGVRFYESSGFERTGDHYDDNLDVPGYVYSKELQ